MPLKSCNDLLRVNNGSDKMSLHNGCAIEAGRLNLRYYYRVIEYTRMFRFRVS